MLQRNKTFPCFNLLCFHDVVILKQQAENNKVTKRVVLYKNIFRSNGNTESVVINVACVCFVQQTYKIIYLFLFIKQLSKQTLLKNACT
jgi:hypothetical protein